MQKLQQIFVFHSITFASVIFPTTKTECPPDLMKFIYLKPCETTSNSLINQHNYSVYIDRDCSIKFKGCLDIRKQASEAKGKIEVKFGMISIPIRTDLCVDATEPRKIVGKVLQAMELKCPLEPGLLCPKGSLDLAKEITQMGIKGEFIDRIELTHDNGERTCIEMKAVLN